jgi:sulfur-carrier protein
MSTPVSVRLFARARDLAGAQTVDVELSDAPTVGELRRRLGEQFPALDPLLNHLLIAVNEEYVPDDAPIPARARVACFPPVSGG